MLGAALGALGMSGDNGEYAVDTSGGLKGMIQQLAQRGTASEPNIPMSESYNSAASSPVFPPADQERAAAVFGTNDQRQASTNGFKQEIKERIMKDISSL
jgi:hypothetical protein